MSVGPSPTGSGTTTDSSGSVTVKRDGGVEKTNVVITMSESEYREYLNSKKNRN